MDDHVELEINPVKILWIIKKDLFPKQLLITWSILTTLVILLYLLDAYTEFTIIFNFPISDLLSAGITGISFTLALISATTKIFSKSQLVSIFSYTDEDNPKEGYLFYRTIAPYIWTATNWLAIALIALFSRFVSFNVHGIFDKIIEIFVISLVIMGLLNLWSLVITHIKDVILDVERTINSDSEN